MPTVGYPKYYSQVEGEVEELSDTETIRDIYARLASFGIANVYPNAQDQTLDLATALNSATPPIFPPGATFYISTNYVLGQPAMLDLGARSDWHCDANGSTFVIRWDVTNDTTIDATLGQTGIRFLDWKRSSLTGFAVDYFPKPAFRGTIEGLIIPSGYSYATALVIRPLQGQEPAFKSADKIEIVDPTTQKVDDWVHYKTTPGSLLPNGDGTWTFTPVPKPSNITQVFSLNPLTIRAPGNGLTEGLLTTITNVPAGQLEIGGISVVNNRTFSVKPGRFDGDDDGGGGGDEEDEATSTYLRLYDLSTGLPINATGATAYVSGGIATGVGVPTAAAVGKNINVFVRKRAGGNVLSLNRVFNSKIEPWIKASSSLAITASACRNIDMGDWLIDSGDATPSCSAGGLLARDCDGYFNAGDWTVRNIGDCAWAVRAVDWTPFITAFDTTSITVSGWSDGASKSQLPLTPRKGQIVTFHQNGARVATRTILNVTGNTATFTATLPTGYDPTTWQLTPGYTASQKHGDILIDGDASSGLTAQTDNFTAERITLLRVRGDGIRFSQPSVAKPGGSGAGDGFAIGEVIARTCGGKLSSNRGSIITLRRLDNTGAVATVAQNTRPCRIGRLDVDGSIYGVVSVAGFNLEIGNYSARNTGLGRGSKTAGVPLPNNDIYAERGSVTVGRLFGAAPSVYTATGGQLIPAGSVTAAP